MKIVYPMQLAGEGTPKEIASLDEFISQLNKLNSGTFPIGRNRIWHGGVHLSEKGGWHSSGAVRSIADGEIVAYRFATEPAKATRKSEAGEPEHEIDLYTSPSFCLIRHRYEVGEKNKNCLTFYSLYMHIACENSYSAEPERYVVDGNDVSIYKGSAGLQLKSEDKLGVARKGAEVILVDRNNWSERYNLRNEPQIYQLMCYAEPKAGDPELFYIAAKYIKAECKMKPNWLTPPESKPARYTVPNNTWLRKTADSTEESAGVPAGSEVVLLGEQQMVTINGGLADFRQVQVFKVGSGTVKNSANQVMANASKGSIGWLAKNKFGAALTAESSIPIEFDKVVLRDSNPIAVQAGEVIGHWGEHQVATLSMSGFSIDPDQKAVHFEVFVGEKDKREKQELNDCIQNKAQVTGGQDYLVLNKDKVVTYRLINHKKQLSYEALAKFGPLNTPLAVKKTDIVTHGTKKFVRVRERAAEKDELAGEFVLLASDAELLSQHDWGKLGVKLVDGSNDPDGFLDKEDTEGQEGGIFFSTLYDRLIIDRDNDNVLSGDEIKSALADDDLASKLRQLFIKHESEWIKREKGWPRLEKELAKQPELYKYAMQVHNKMAWVEEAKRIFGGNKMWFIHPAGIIGLVKSYQVKVLWVLGKTSEKYESGGRGPGVVSSGKGDYGGVSYGCYQLSSNLRVVQQYIKYSKYKDLFDGLSPATNQFNDTWKEIAAKNSEEFREEQHRFMKETHYDIQIEMLRSKGLLIEHARAAVHDLIWSTSVQFGPKTKVIIKALHDTDLQSISDKELIIRVQDYKRDNTETLFKSSPTLWEDLKVRADSEKKLLLDLESEFFEVNIK